MKAFTKKILILAGSFILLGVILVAVTGFMGIEPGFLITSQGLRTSSDIKRGQLEETIKIEPVKRIQIVMEETNIRIEEGNDYEIEYHCNTMQTKPTWQVENGVLTLQEDKQQGNNGWQFNFYLQEPLDYVTIRVPKDKMLECLSVEAKGGDIALNQVSVKELLVTNTYGEQNFTELNCDKAQIKTKDGTIHFADGTIKDLDIAVKYGDLKLQNLQNETLAIEGADGDIEVANVNSKKMQIINTYGEVTLELPQEEKAYCYELNAKNGEIALNQQNFQGYVKLNEGANQNISVQTEEDISIKTS